LSKRQSGLRQIFPTVLMERGLDALLPLNERLREIILEREACDPGVTASNVSGWHSSPDLLDWGHPELQTIGGAFLATRP